MSSEGFLSRWSRRKQEIREAGQPDRVPPAEAGPAEPEQTPEAAASDESGVGMAPGEPELTPDEIARLPSLDELTAETDLSLFLRKGVPESLRNAALRRMWSLDPTIRDFVSEAREYAYDWNTPGGVPGSGGVLPPSEEVARMAARIVGGEFATEAEPPAAAGLKLPEPPLAPAPTADPDTIVAAQAEASAGLARAPAPNAASPPPLEDEAKGAVGQQDRADEPAGPVARRHGSAMPL